jgi:hypothetical protein
MSTAPTPFGTGCLLARRLVEAGVRFVNVDYPGGQIWDDHRDVNDNLRKRCPGHGPGSGGAHPRSEAPRHARRNAGGVGRRIRPHAVSESGSGRDHNPYGYTMCVAGGGFKGGIAYGATGRVRVQGSGESRVYPRLARHAAAPARHGSHEADLSLCRPRTSA